MNQPFPDDTVTKVRYQPDTERLITDLETMRVYFDPMRTRIIRALAHEPRSVQQIAEILDVPFTRLYYHFNMLEKHGIIRMVETRAISGAVEEKFYQITARSFIVDRALLTVRPANGEEDGLEFLLETVFDDVRRDVRHSAEVGLIDLNATPPNPTALLARRGTVNLTPERARYFHHRFLALLDEMLDDGADDETGDYYSLVVSMYPTVQPFEPSDDELLNSL
jgi:DNA-binding transcriptional ArsR family regulator